MTIARLGLKVKVIGQRKVNAVGLTSTLLPRFYYAERISTILWHILSYNCYLKTLVRTPRAFTPRAGAKTAFGDRLWNLTEHISATEHDINKWKEILNPQWLMYMPLKFCELSPRNGWEWLDSFCPPPKFSHWDTLPALPHGRYITDSRQTLARVMQWH